MSDRERIVALLDDLGVVWCEAEEFHNKSGLNIEVKANDGPKNLGYTEFLTLLSFDSEGNFESWGCWE